MDLPREALRTAIQADSAAMIAEHNHQTEDPPPSVEDGWITTSLNAAAHLGRQLKSTDRSRPHQLLQDPRIGRRPVVLHRPTSPALPAPAHTPGAIRQQSWHGGQAWLLAAIWSQPANWRRGGDIPAASNYHRGAGLASLNKRTGSYEVRVADGAY